MYASRNGDFSQIVSQQVHDHHVRGTILSRLAQPSCVFAIFVEPAPASLRPFHRTRHHVIATALKEELRRKTKDLMTTKIEIRRVRCALRVTQFAIPRVSITTERRR